MHWRVPKNVYDRHTKSWSTEGVKCFLRKLLLVLTKHIKLLCSPFLLCYNQANRLHTVLHVYMTLLLVYCKYMSQEIWIRRTFSGNTKIKNKHIHFIIFCLKISILIYLTVIWWTKYNLINKRTFSDMTIANIVHYVWTMHGKYIKQDARGDRVPLITKFNVLIIQCRKMSARKIVHQHPTFR